MGSQRVGHDWETKHNFSFIPGVAWSSIHLLWKTLKSPRALHFGCSEFKCFLCLIWAPWSILSYISLLSVSPSLFFLSFVPFLFFSSLPSLFLFVQNFAFPMLGLVLSKGSREHLYKFLHFFLHCFPFLRKFLHNLKVHHYSWTASLMLTLLSCWALFGFSLTVSMI